MGALLSSGASCWCPFSALAAAASASTHARMCSTSASTASLRSDSMPQTLADHVVADNVIIRWFIRVYWYVIYMIEVRLVVIHIRRHHLSAWEALLRYVHSPTIGPPQSTPPFLIFQCWDSIFSATACCKCFSAARIASAWPLLPFSSIEPSLLDCHAIHAVIEDSSGDFLFKNDTFVIISVAGELGTSVLEIAFRRGTFEAWHALIYIILLEDFSLIPVIYYCL